MDSGPETKRSIDVDFESNLNSHIQAEAFFEEYFSKLEKESKDFLTKLIRKFVFLRTRRLLQMPSQHSVLSNEIDFLKILLQNKLDQESQDKNISVMKEANEAMKDASDSAKYSFWAAFASAGAAIATIFLQFYFKK